MLDTLAASWLTLVYVLAAVVPQKDIPKVTTFHCLLSLCAACVF